MLSDRKRKCCKISRKDYLYEKINCTFCSLHNAGCFYDRMRHTGKHGIQRR